MSTEQQEVLVPVSDGEPRKGVIVGEDIDEHAGQVFIIQFPSGWTSRLTEREIIRVVLEEAAENSVAPAKP